MIWTLLVACEREPPPPPEERPACDAPQVTAGLLRLADTAGKLPAKTQALVNVRETAARAFPELGPATFQRLCVGRLGLENGDNADIGWEIFTASTTLGPSWTLKPCLGKWAQDPSACDAYTKGRTPAEAEALRIAASRRGAPVGTATLQADGQVALALNTGGDVASVTVLFTREEFAASGWVTDTPLTAPGESVPVRAPTGLGTRPGEAADTGAAGK